MDLMTPISHWNFPGLQAGSYWCLCISRWLEAEKAGKAPPIVLKATHQKILQYTSLELLEKYAVITEQSNYKVRLLRKLVMTHNYNSITTFFSMISSTPKGTFSPAIFTNVVRTHKLILYL
jgi:hypothetical protein